MHVISQGSRTPGALLYIPVIKQPVDSTEKVANYRLASDVVLQLAVASNARVVFLGS